MRRVHLSLKRNVIQVWALDEMTAEQALRRYHSRDTSEGTIQGR